MKARSGRAGEAATAVGALLMVLSFCGPFSLAAQTDSAAAADPATSSRVADRADRAWVRDVPASPLLPPGHWAVRAASRAEALGLADGWMAAQGAVPRAVLLDVLHHAAERAEGGRYAGLAAGWLARFREEFAEYGAPGDPLLLPVNGHAAAGFTDEQGRLSPAIGYFALRQPPEPVPAVSTPRLDVAAGTGDGRHAAIWALGRWDDAGFGLARWEAVAAAGPVAISAGRQPVAYGWGEGGGVVLSETNLTRVEAQTLRPIHLPGVLRAAGGVTLHTFVSRVGGERHPDEPWLWGARLAFQPHRRLAFAVNRGAIFGGEEEAVTPGRLLAMFAGVIRNSRFENQILSLEGRWRLPTEAVLPATVYLEWGADDGAGALHEVPARVAGVLFPALPGAPRVSAGAEYARFNVVCCGHGPWYFNTTHPGNWARGTRTLGHPLGGEGWEAAGYARADLLDSRLRLHLRGFRRHRSEASFVEFGGGNLFSTARTGGSSGVVGEAAFRLTPRAEVRAAAFREEGDGWRERRLDAAVSVFF